MVKFTIRDVLWLTVVVAMGLGWWIDAARRQDEIVAYRVQNRDRKAVTQILQGQSSDRTRLGTTDIRKLASPQISIGDAIAIVQQEADKRDPMLAKEITGTPTEDGFHALVTVGNVRDKSGQLAGTPVARYLYVVSPTGEVVRIVAVDAEHAQANTVEPAKPRE